jgi:hypothetical protein
MGPVEYLIVEFPGNEFSGEIVPALMDLTESGTIHIIDLIFITKDPDGDVAWFELDSLESGEAGDYDDLVGDICDLLNEEDIRMAAEQLEPNHSAAMLVFENVWATRLRDAIVNSNGKLIENARIPAAIVQEALAAAGIDEEEITA